MAAADGKVSGDPVWLTFLTRGIPAITDGIRAVDSPSPAAMPEQIAPEPTNRDTEPYLLRVIRNPASQAVLAVTVLAVLGIGIYAAVKRRG